MPVHRGNIVQVINAAWEKARREKVDGEINTSRSRNWIDALAAEFQKRYTGEHHRTFWRGNCENKKHFRKNELLFDLVICSVSETESLQSRSNLLEFIAECHWQIESEFNRRDTREILIDMSKLVLGSATHKLFVAAHSDGKNRDILKQVSELAERCSGHVYFAFVAHPGDWGKEEPEPPKVYEWLAGSWEPLPSTTEAR